MDPFLDHLERDDDIITNGSQTTVYTFILQAVMKPLYGRRQGVGGRPLLWPLDPSALLNVGMASTI